MLPCHFSGLLLALQRAAPIQVAAWRHLWCDSNLNQQSQSGKQPQGLCHTSKCPVLQSASSSSTLAQHPKDSISGNYNHSSSMKATPSYGPCSSCTTQARVQGLTAMTGLKAFRPSTQHKPLRTPQHTFASRAVQGSCLPSSARGISCIAAAGAEAGGTRARRSRRSVASPPASPASDSGTTTVPASDNASPTGSNRATSSSRRTSRASSSSTRTAKQAGHAAPTAAAALSGQSKAAAAAGGESSPGQSAQEAQQLLGQLQQYCEAYYAGRPLVSSWCTLLGCVDLSGLVC
jgi:hypothetical protein